MVTSMLAVTMNRMGYHTAILDADITGPSIPKAFGIREKATGSELGIFPVKSKTGIDIMSVNLLLENDKEHKIFGDSHIEEIAEKHNIKVLAKLPIDSKIPVACDNGMIELFDGNWFEPVAKILIDMQLV